jgi:predicted RND superfamily exporter protein
MQTIDKNLKENKFTIEPYYFVEMYYQFACLFLANNNLSKSLKFINTILNEFSIEDRPKTFVKTEILNLIIHYELKNYKLVLNKFSTLKKKYQKSFNLNEIEKKLLNTIIKLATNPYGINERVSFQKLIKKIDKIESIDKTSSNKIYLNYINKKKN